MLVDSESLHRVVELRPIARIGDHPGHDEDNIAESFPVAAEQVHRFPGNDLGDRFSVTGQGHHLPGFRGTDEPGNSDVVRIGYGEHAHDDNSTWKSNWNNEAEGIVAVTRSPRKIREQTPVAAGPVTSTGRRSRAEGRHPVAQTDNHSDTSHRHLSL